MIEIKLPSIEELIEQAEVLELAFTEISLCLIYWNDKNYNTKLRPFYEDREEKSVEFDMIVERIGKLKSYRTDELENE